MVDPLQNDDEFQDPLENYDPPTFDDPIERALHEELVTDIQTQPCTTIAADATVEAALKELVGEGIACVLVEEGG